MTHHGQPENPYGPPQLPPQPYGQQYAPPPQPYAQPPAVHEPPRRSQGLAIAALVVGVVAAVMALTVARGIAPVIGLIAAILAIIALVAKSQGGTKFAAAGLALGLASLPLAIILFMVAQGQQARNDQSVRCMQDAIAQGKSADEMWACGK